MVLVPAFSGLNDILIGGKVTKLITALRLLLRRATGLLDKEATSHDDCFDAFRMSLQ